MKIEQFFQQSHIFIITGKGGTGKTVSSVALAMLAAEYGLNTLLVTFEADSHIFELLDVKIQSDNGSPEIGENLHVRLITAEDALLTYLLEHGMGKISKRLLSTNTVDVIANAIPGIQEILILGRLKQLERDRVADVIIVDAPATGHAITLLTSPTGLTFAARGGSLRKQADEVSEMLKDNKRCQVLLVTIPEETPINEAIDAAYLIEDKTDVTLGPIIVNQIYNRLTGLETDAADAAQQAGMQNVDPEIIDILNRAGRFRLSRLEAQKELLDKLDGEIALPKIYLPLILEKDFTKHSIVSLSKDLERQITKLENIFA